MSTELYIERENTHRNPTNGHYTKGHVPHNKGRRWNEYLGLEQQKKILAAATWNLRNHLHDPRPATAERCRKPLIGLTDDGNVRYFSHAQAAANWIVGSRACVNRCCRLNASHGTNTDHRYKGIRFYFENDDNWTKKIAK